MNNPPSTPNLPAPVASYIDAVNHADLQRAVAAFAADAVVNDIRREFIGAHAISAWLEREIIGDAVRLDVLHAREHHGSTIVTARTTGNFDKTNLPDPLDLTFYFTGTPDAITQLIVIANQPTPIWAFDQSRES